MSARFTLICSAHGFGHLTRQLALGEALRAAGAELRIVTSAPAQVVEETLPGVEVLGRAVDVGIAQHDSLSEDLDRSLALLEERCSEAAIDGLAELLIGWDGVVVDIAPAALEAARRAGVPALAVGNFDWAWIYDHYPALRTWAARFRAWQAPHPAVSLWPGPGLTGFASVTPLGLLGRRAPALALPGPERKVLVSFGGFGLAGLDALLPRIPGLTWVLAPPCPLLDREDCLLVERGPYPGLVAGVDAVFTKPGYGILAECMLAGTPIAWVARGAFPEAPTLERALRARGDLPVPSAPTDPSFPSALAATLARLLDLPRPSPVTSDAAETLARMLLRAIPCPR